MGTIDIGPLSPFQRRQCCQKCYAYFRGTILINSGDGGWGIVYFIRIPFTFTSIYGHSMMNDFLCGKSLCSGRSLTLLRGGFITEPERKIMRRYVTMLRIVVLWQCTCLTNKTLKRNILNKTLLTFAVNVLTDLVKNQFNSSTSFGRVRVCCKRSSHMHLEGPTNQLITLIL